jgi:hypothetical protein
MNLIRLLLLVAAVPAVGADPAFWLRNTDKDALFIYWSVADPAPDPLAALPLAAGGAHPVAPGERVRVTVAAGSRLVAVFVPWKANLDYLTPLAGGELLPAEFPAKGTLLVDTAAFAAANRGRALLASLQAWGLTPPALALGKPGVWDTVRPLVEWGPSFQPGRRPWPKGWPRVVRLQALDREGALWVRLGLTPGSLPPGVTVSLALRRPGAFLEWPLSGADATVWSWADGADPVSAGTRLAGAGFLEGWVPWDRMPGADRAAWTSAPLTWSLIVTTNQVPAVLDLTPTVMAEWP